jgi:hypothetical protein
MILIEETDDRFYLAESTVPHAGKGVFAKVDLPKGEYLEIIGAFVENLSLTDECTNYARDYKFAARKEKSTRKIVPFGFGGMVNHALSDDQMNAVIDYRKGSKRNQNASDCCYRFIKDIKAGEEILGHYGEWWENVFSWANESESILNDEADECRTFLDHGLYNLDLIKHLME